jgi:hypothetical protein
VFVSSLAIGKSLILRFQRLDFDVQRTEKARAAADLSEIRKRDFRIFPIAAATRVP